MTQRNPMNERYNSDEHKGKTRKSAASAKPKARAAASVYVESKAPRPKKRGMLAKAQADANRKAEKAAAEKKKKPSTRIKPEYYNVPTEEYRRVRRMWWICISTSIIGMALSYILQGVYPDTVIPSAILLGVAYVAIFVALYIDMVKTRRIRRAWQAQCEAHLRTKEGRREAAKLAEEQEKRAQAYAEEKAAKRAARKARFSFGKKEEN